MHSAHAEQDNYSQSRLNCRFVDPVLECSRTNKYAALLHSVSPEKYSMDLFRNSSKSVFGDVDPVLECSRTNKYAALLHSVSPSQNSDFEGFERGPI
jgi:hypothetical protein